MQLNRKRILSQVRVHLDKRSSLFCSKHQNGFEYQRKGFIPIPYLFKVYVLQEIAELFFVLQFDMIFSNAEGFEFNLWPKMIRAIGSTASSENVERVIYENQRRGSDF